MKNVYAYIRVSTIKQGTHGVSLQEQRTAIEHHARQNNLTITKWFEEQETAAKRGRAVFNVMLQLLKAGKADGVVIHKIDRSARNLKDWADLGELIDNGITVHFANESLDMQTRGGRLSADIQAVIAADYIRNLREETRKGFYGRLKQGLYPLPAPLGYLNQGSGAPKTIDTTIGPLAKKAFELYGTGSFTLQTLADDLYQRGLRNANGRKVSKNALSRMLNNPFYMGIICVKRTGELFTGVHTPLINKRLFDRVQHILNRRTNTKVVRHNFLFRKLFSCKHCGNTLSGEIQKEHVYYRCHTRSCKATSIREEIIEREVKKTLKNTQLSQNEVDILRGLTQQLRSSWNEEKHAILNRLQLLLGQYGEKLNRLTDAYLDQVIDRELFEHRKNDLILKKKDVHEQIDAIKNGTVSVPDKIMEFLEQTKSLSVTYTSGITEEKRDVLEIATSNRLVNEKKPYMRVRKPFMYVADYKKYSYGGLCKDELRTNNCNGTHLHVLFNTLHAHFTTEEEK
ncbi:MAG: recombinase family protein [Candidatus Thiodiazotropha sp. (ex Dulcina madagascariensis)]|nr:recombinase family protein [Candidatus Thiodiazotropha sp. (ex Dulcina madagascariensis)]